MFVLQEPFFWAFIGMFGLVAGAAAVSGTVLGKYAPLGFAIVMICDFSRILLVLPFVSQPRFDFGVWDWVIGGVIIVIASIFAFSAFSIKWWAAPQEDTVLKTTGVYGVVRNPIYLADMLFSLGIAIVFGSIIGVVLIPLWWASYLFIALIEEQALERTVGEPYRAYRQRVKGRIIPGLPI